MDVDTQNMEDNDDSGGKVWAHPALRVPLDLHPPVPPSPLQRRYEEHEAAKVRMVPGPQREEYDKVSRAFS
jgi:hypothetical protein